MPALGEVGSAIKNFLVRTPGAIMHHGKDLLGHPGEVAPRLLHPIKGIQEGWHEMSPVVQIGKRAKELGYRSPQAAISHLGRNSKKVKEMIGSGLTGARHEGMLDPGISLGEAWRKGGLKGTAEELFKDFGILNPSSE